MMSEAQTSPTPATAAQRLSQMTQRTNPRFDALRRLRRHPSAVAGVAVLCLILVLPVLAPLIARFAPIETFRRESRSGPSMDHWLGTDQLGRDIWRRILWGGRISLVLGLMAVAIGGIIGTILG